MPVPLDHEATPQDLEDAAKIDAAVEVLERLRAEIDGTEPEDEDDAEFLEVLAEDLGGVSKDLKGEESEESEDNEEEPDA